MFTTNFLVHKPDAQYCTVTQFTGVNAINVFIKFRQDWMCNIEIVRNTLLNIPTIKR